MSHRSTTGNAPGTRTPFARHGIPMLLGALVALPHCGSSDSNHAARSEQQALSGFSAGVYTIADSASFAIDGGFYYWTGLTTEEVYQRNDGADQQWTFAASGSGYTICNVGVSNACLSDGGGKLQIGVGTDVWNLANVGAGYSIQSQSRGLYITDPSAPANSATVPTSSTASSWTLTLQGGGGGGGTPLAAGTYNFKDSSGNTWDGGFARAGGDPYVYEYSYNDGGDQQFIWTGSTLRDSLSGSYAFNSSSTLGLGSSAGTFAIVSSGSGYTIQDKTTGLYVNSPFADSPPNKLGLSSSPTVWTAVSVGGGGGGTIMVDDSDPSVIYSRSEANGTWLVGSNSADFDGSSHYNNACQNPPQTLTPVQGPMAVLNFDGTAVSLIGMLGNNLGIGAYAIDGGPLTTVDAYNPAANVYQQTLLTVSGLAPGSHALSYQVTCNKNSSSSNYYQVIDAYRVTGTALPASSAQVGAWNTVTLGGSWSSGTTSTDLSGGQVWSGTAGNTISWTFTGSLIEMFGRPDVGDGLFDVYIDGVEVAANVDSHYETVDNDLLTAYMLWAGKVTPGKHTITIVVTGTEDAYNEAEDSGQKNLIQFDEFLAFP